MSAAPVLEMQGVVKDYRGLRPLRVAALTVAPGERVAIEGFDRAAGETFVNLVNGAYAPDAGTVRVFGVSTTDIATDTAWLASLDRFGMVTERAVLLEGAPIDQNLALPFSLEIDPMPEDVRARVEALASELGIEGDALAARAGEASPAVRARVHLARALALGPELLLLEHPTASLERTDVQAYAALVRRIAESRAMTLVAVSNDREFSDAVASTSLKLNPGTGALSSNQGWRRWLR